jgi:hypothetical protein
MPRNPNEPIPGFPEYTGTVRHEKKVHQNQFLVNGLNLRKTNFETGYEWEKRGLKWVLVKKEKENERSN